MGTDFHFKSSTVTTVLGIHCERIGKGRSSKATQEPVASLQVRDVVAWATVSVKVVRSGWIPEIL